MNNKYRIVKTPLGYVGFVATARGVRRVYLPETTKTTLRRAIKNDHNAIGEDDTLLPELADNLRQYFTGEKTDFAVRLDFDDASPFHVAIWKACRQVRYGKTVSYGELARRAGKPGAARAVGTAMSRNPLPIVVPCHRVLKSDGTLGGYSGPGGVELKRRLLEMESTPQVV
ncbi:MAG: methylated-DNA--[protein]-cysteine S-methyltransferase [Phycisphaerae bacterium]|nr:methylated-DNA--[protein]-cysteine S-methyltransferase [Phycisphaerae bacterium]